MVWAPVPVAAVNEDGDSRARKHKVCPSIQIGNRPSVDAVTEPMGMHRSSDREFRGRVPTPVPTHRRSYRCGRGPRLVLRNHTVSMPVARSVANEDQAVEGEPETSACVNRLKKIDRVHVSVLRALSRTGLEAIRERLSENQEAGI